MTTVEPEARVGPAWITGFTLAWLGIWLAQLTVIQLLLPQQVADATLAARRSAGESGQTPGFLPEVVQFGWVSAVAGVVALVVFPVVGALSDRTVSRFGRRRPWIAVGTVVFAGGLVLLGLQNSVTGITVGWSIALGGFAVLSSALTALIADQVPVQQRGVVSAFVSMPQALGTILGLLLIEALALSRAGSFAVAAAVLVVLVLPFLVRAPDPSTIGHARRPIALRTVVATVWIDPRSHPDFAWTLAGRLLVNLGNALGTTLLLYYLADGLGSAQPDDDLIALVLVYLVCLVVATLLAGRASDRSGRRRVFVALAALLQAVAALIIAVVPAYSTTVAAAGLLGAGYGIFLSVDQALATQVLPEPENRGKDLGIMNIALAVPQAFGPIVGALVIVVFGGFEAMFIAAAVLSMLGALAVLRVRGVA